MIYDIAFPIGRGALWVSERIPAGRKWPAIQVNRAIRYILYARSQTAGTQGASPVKGGRTPGGRSEQGQRRKAAMAEQRATNRIQAL